MVATLEQLRREYQERRLGPVILEELRRTVEDLVRRYNPTVYAGAASWEDGVDDVVQGVVLEILLEEGQLDYIMATAVRIEDVRRLLRFQIKRYLARRRRRTVVDNLLDRCKERLRAPPFSVIDPGPPERYAIATGAAADPRPPTDEELRAAAKTAALVPRARPSAGDRAPIVYTAGALDALLESVARILTRGFSLSDLGTVLEMVLTDWVVGFLCDLEGAQDLCGLSLGPEEEAVSAAAVAQIVEGCTDEQLLILRRKLEDVPDETIARELGVSRPTVHTRKQEALKTIEAVLRDMPEGLQAEVIDRLSLHLARLESPGGPVHGQ